MGQQQEGQTSLTSSTVSPSVAADPAGHQPIRDGSQGQTEQKPQLKDYFVCSALFISMRPCLIVISVFSAMQPRLTFLPTLWVSFRPSRRELLYHWWMLFSVWPPHILLRYWNLWWTNGLNYSGSFVGNLSGFSQSSGDGDASMLRHQIDKLS